MANLKFSEFTQALASLLKVDETEVGNYFMVGHTEKATAEDNVKFPLLDLLNAVGGDTTYASSESDATEMSASLGGLPAGTTALTLKSMTLSEVLDAILFPIVAPTRAAKSLSFAGISQEGLQEVGAELTSALTLSFSLGQITNGGGTAGPTLVGQLTSYNFTGPGIGGAIVQNFGDAGAGSYSATFTVTLGSQQWSGTVNHAAGTGGYSDNKGNPSTLFDAERVSASINVNSGSVTGIYPIFYGVNATDLAPGAMYAGLNKLVQQKGTKNLSLVAANQYVYFAFPASYGDLSQIKDGNGFNVTSSFTKTTITLTSVGLASNYSVSYVVYKTTSPTTINNQSYQFSWTA